MKLTTKEKQSLRNAFEYMATVTLKQNRILPFRELYGDGSRFGELSRFGVLMVYKEFCDKFAK